MTLPDTFLKWIVDRKKQVCHRQLVVVTGEHDWVKNSIAVIRPLLSKNSLFVGDSDWPIRCQNSTYRTQLGLEFDNLVYDVFCGFRANALIALSGTVKSGGLMIILAPDLDIWPSFNDPNQQQRTSYGYDGCESKSHFISWLVERIHTDTSVCVLSKTGFSGEQNVAFLEQQAVQTTDKTTADQLNAIDKIVSNYRQKKSFQLVLSADRGRGKSATLGLAAQRLLNETELDIAVTAPQKSMTQNVFKHVNNKENILYIPFDELLSNKRHFDLVFVDEAAAIPTPILKSLVSTFPKIIFSTTTHGYEGSGKGFELRFMPYLRKLNTEAEVVTLRSPVRWFEDDFLEDFWFKTMLMTPMLDQINISNCIEKSFVSRTVSSKELINNPDMFFQIFQLLVNAHYQTTPDDLVRLLDAQEQYVHITTTQNTEVIAVALISLEGGSRLDDIASSISMGSRRVNGHLIPQRLAFVRCTPSFAQKTYTRIVRIAVREDYRRMKIASQLTDYIAQWSCDNSIDLIGASFGVSTEVLEFWQSNKFNAVHLGLKRDASSGEHSLIVLKHCGNFSATKNNMDEDINFLIRKFSQELSFQSNYRLNKVDRKVIELLTTHHAEKTIELEHIDKVILSQFANGHRPLYSCEYQLATLIEIHSCQLVQDNSSDFDFFYRSLVEKWPYKRICERYHLTGKKQIEEYARDCCSTLLKTIKKTL